MADHNEKLEYLRSRLEALIRRHGEISVEMYQIQEELRSLTEGTSPGEPTKPEPLEAPSRTTRMPELASEPAREVETPLEPTTTPSTPPLSSYESVPSRAAAFKAPANLERWVGENLISKIGIAITILGVAIGAKYAIDKGWITPVMRIVFGYLVGIGLLYFALRLREKYERFSAVLLSGAMAIFYFISFAAYDYYSLVPQPVAFGLMTAITAFTVLAALRYDRVLIAHIGLIGAYAVPFLLSEGTGRYAFLFSYVALVNAGILAVSIARYWRSLFYPSFVITWSMFALWYFFNYEPAVHLSLGIGFATTFFAIFYASYIVYKLLQGLQFAAENVLLILANAFVFYGLVYGMASQNEVLSDYLGPITLANAALHLAVAASVYRFASADRTVISLLVALVISFVTIAVPVQLDGSWVTLVWIVEAAVLFVIARHRSIPLYEWFSYPLVMLAMASLFRDWVDAPDTLSVTPIINKGFLTAALFALSLAVMLWTDRRRDAESTLPKVVVEVGRIFFSALLVFVAYNAFRLEISNYWNQDLFSVNGIAPPGKGPDGRLRDPYIPLMNFVWQLNYSMAFTSIVWILNKKLFKSRALKIAAAVFCVFWLILFAAGGLPALGELRNLYVDLPADLPSHGAAAIAVRYAVYFLAAVLAWILFLTSADTGTFSEDSVPKLRRLFDLFVHFLILCTLSAELFTWMEIAGIADSGKLALSILWGLYAVAMLALGILHSKRHLRVGAIILFAITLLKVFIYDLAELGTVSRTIVFVSLGVLLLVASFLYSKYREAIFGKD